MLNKKLVKTATKLITIIIAVVLLVSGFVVGNAYRTAKDEQKIKEITESVQIKQADNKWELKRKDVQDFLLTYYTKKDLGENRERYKPFMSEGLYNSVVNEEDKPANTVYQGYIVDWEYESSDIYINTTDKTALVTVKYKNTTLAIKDDRSKSSTQSNKVSLKLIYTKSKDGLVVNQMETIAIEPVVERR